ncbi:MAG: RDD family protein [Myxococcales bacterium]
MDDVIRRLESVHVVRTPEYVEFEFPLAGVMTRFLAWLIDVLISTMVAASASVVVVLGASLAPGLATALVFIIWFLVNWGYFLFLEYRYAGQTIGKRVLGLRTIQDNGVRVGFYQATMRNLVRAVDHLPLLYLGGGALALISKKTRRLGDIAGGTVVIRDRRRAIPASIARPSELVPALQERKVEDRIRRASVEEREVLLSAALRREELSMEARLTLFKALSEYVTERFSLEKPVHLSDEKYVVAIASALVQERPALTSPARRMSRPSQPPFKP